MKVVKLMALFMFALFFISWGFWGSNSGLNYNSRSYVPSYSYSGIWGTPSWYVHANSGTMAGYRSGIATFTIPSYYTTFGNYRYW